MQKPRTVHLTVFEVEAARIAGMTPLEYARAKIAVEELRARRRAAALKGWRTRMRRLRPRKRA